MWPPISDDMKYEDSRTGSGEVQHPETHLFTACVAFRVDILVAMAAFSTVALNEPSYVCLFVVVWMACLGITLPVGDHIFSAFPPVS